MLRIARMLFSRASPVRCILVCLACSHFWYCVGFLDPSQRVDPQRLVEYEQESESRSIR